MPVHACMHAGMQGSGCHGGYCCKTWTDNQEESYAGLYIIQMSQHSFYINCTLTELTVPYVLPVMSGQTHPMSVVALHSNSGCVPPTTLSIAALASQYSIVGWWEHAGLRWTAERRQHVT